MKRKLAVFLTLAMLVCVVPISAFAVDLDSYDYVFVTHESKSSYVMETSLPEGIYDVYAFAEDALEIFLLFENVQIAYEYLDGAQALVSFPFDGDIYELNIIVYGDQTGMVMRINDVAVDAEGTLVFVPVGGSGAPQISDYVSSESMSGALDQIVAILPVIIVVVVSFIAIRKGIRFIQDVVRNG